MPLRFSEFLLRMIPDTYFNPFMARRQIDY